MKITDYSRAAPGIILGSVNTIGGVTANTNIRAVPGTVPVATSSNAYEWRDALSFGSNTNDVSSVGTMGSSPSNTRADHVHRGVHAITAAGSNAVYGDVNLVAGTGMAITTSGQNVRFDGTSTIAAGTYFLASFGGQGVRGSLGNLGSTETINLANGLYQLGTLNANCTISFTGWTNGTYCEVSLRLTEDGTGGWTPTFSGVTWIGGTTPTHTTTLNTSTEYTFWSVDGGTTIIGGQLGSGESFVLSHPSTSSNSFTSNAVLTNDASIAITMPQFGTLHFSAPFVSEVVTDSSEIVWHGSDVVHDLVRIY